MKQDAKRAVPDSIDATLKLLGEANYLADRSLSTVLFLALRMGRPIFLEGEAGVGKTEIAKVLASTLGRRLIRLQCYEGLDVASAVYEWNYAAQMIAIRLGEAEGNADRARLERLQQRPLDQKAVGEDVVLDALAVARPLGFGEPDGDHLRRVIPFIDRSGNVEAFVAL